MLFSGIPFLFYFLPLLLVLYLPLRNHLNIANGLLLVFSLIFYAWGEPAFVFIMLLSIALNYLIGRAIHTVEAETKGYWLLLGIVGNLGLLVYFKYLSFIFITVAGWGGLTVQAPNITLPIGISFFTFQAITYLVDLYHGKIKVQKSLLKLALYISLFPQLIAGPIVRYKEIEKQLSKRTVTLDGFSAGVRRFLVGLAKKVLLANTFAQVADEIFALSASELSAPLVIIGVVAYTFQIYFDFSGYSDMAIGLGRMFGFSFPENFNYPYISRSVTEFWQRWHLTLSHFFRDYLYIPLGGNRLGKAKTYRNLLIVFFLCGLWHGAAITFVLWGMYFGVFLVIERIGLRKLLQQLPSAISWVYTSVVVMFGWLLFRANDITQVKTMLNALFAGASNELYLKYLTDSWLITTTVIALVAVTPVVERTIGKTKAVQDVALAVCFVLSIAFLAAGTYNPFIYFRF